MLRSSAARKPTSDLGRKKVGILGAVDAAAADAARAARSARVSASTSASSSAGDPEVPGARRDDASPPGGGGNDATRCAAHGAAASASRDSFAFADGMALVASQSAAAGLAGRSVMATNTSPRRKLTNDGIEAVRETFDFVNG